MAYTIVPGVRQGIKRNGQYYLYQLASYPNGKVIEVPYLETGAERGYSIPAPVEPVRVSKERMVESTPSVAVVEYRVNGSKEVRHFASEFRFTIEAMVRDLRPLMRSPDCGATWIPVERLPADYFVQYHREESK